MNFDARVLKIETHYDLTRMGFKINLLIFVPDTLDGKKIDELEIYQRVMKIVNVVSPQGEA